MRRTIVLACALAAFPALAKVKVIDFHTLPQSAAGLTALLQKEKAAPVRLAASQVLDELIRKKPVELGAADADQVVAAALDGVFEHMAAPTDLYTWEKDVFGPRGDVLCRENAKLSPGHVSPGFDKRFTKTLKGKRIDRGYLNSPCTLSVTAAQGLSDFHQWTAKGWGIEVGQVLVAEVDKSGAQVARVGLAFVSPGSSLGPPALERPTYVGFALRPKAGEPFALLSVEPPAVLDVRKQPCTLCSSDGKPTDAERHLRLFSDFEHLALVNLAAKELSPADREAFTLDAAQLTAKDKAWLEPWQTSESVVLRAAAALKGSKVGANVPPASLAELVPSLPHPWLKTRLVEELVRVLGPALDQGVAPAEADQKAMWNSAVEKALQSNNTVYDAKVAQGFARLKVSNTPGYLFRQSASGWVLLGSLP
ncbi:MAG: hypothetical protein K1X89_25910 [Myxococcaceae bacterium]|nr:hypothetical protein [Myxococcaceae bacterium]